MVARQNGGYPLEKDDFTLKEWDQFVMVKARLQELARDNPPKSEEEKRAEVWHGDE